MLTLPAFLTGTIARLVGSFALGAGLVWLFAVMPLHGDLQAAERDLSTERANHLDTGARLRAEIQGRAEANALVFVASQQNAALADELDTMQAERDAARRAALAAANTELTDAPSDFDLIVVPDLDGWRVCRDTARILGTPVDAACGSPPADDG